MNFSDYFASKVEPILEKQLAQMPESAREPIREATRAQMAECWNAALDAVLAECGVWPEVAGGINVNICRIGECYLEDVLRAK